MADTTTANYNWVKPEIDGSTDTWGDKLNADLDAIDAKIKGIDGFSAAAKDTPVDADWIGVYDSAAAGNPVKKTTFSKLKAAIQTAYDLVYQKRLVDVVGFELNNSGTTDTLNYIDFHTSATVVDYNARILRNAGTNGTFDIVQTGTGDMRFMGAPNYRFDKPLYANGRVTAVGEFMAQAGTTAGNAHLYLMDADGVTTRTIIYSTQAKAAIIAVAGGTVTYSFNTDGVFRSYGPVYAGAAFMNTDGNIGGTVWSAWGAADAFNAIGARIEARGAAFRNGSVVDSRMAGNVEVQIQTNNTQTVEFNNAGYVLTRMSRNGQGQFGILFGARQPQLYITDRGGWFTAFNY